MAIIARTQQMVAIRVYWRIDREVARFSMPDIWKSDRFDASLQTFATVFDCAPIAWV
jgi:hypothetical protein